MLCANTIKVGEDERGSRGSRERRKLYLMWTDAYITCYTNSPTHFIHTLYTHLNESFFSVANGKIKKKYGIENEKEALVP